MRIIVITNLYPPHHYGGYETACRSVVQGLIARGHDVLVLASIYRHQDGLSEIDPTARELRWYDPVHRDGYWYEASLRDRLRIEVPTRLVLTRQLRRFKPDVVNWWNLGGLPVSLMRQSRRPTVACLLDDWPAWASKADMWHQTLLRHRRLRRFAEIAPPNIWLVASRYLAETTGVSPYEVAHPGVEMIFKPNKRIRKWTGKMLYVGRVEPRKGVDTAIDAVRQSGASLRIVGRGDATYISQLKRQAEALPVAFVGGVGSTELAREYRSADALVFPVRWQEPWGLVPLEAMASGLPVIATGTGGSAEYLEHETNCLRFAPEDSVALASAIGRLAEDPNLRERVRGRGLHTASQFTVAAYVDQIEAALTRESSSGTK